MTQDEGRIVLGASISQEEGIALAQLVNQPGWKILVRIIAEACRRSTEAVVKVKPGTPNRQQIIDDLQSISYATNKFASDVLDSVKVHQRRAVKKAQELENPTVEEPQATRFRMPMPKSESVEQIMLPSYQNESSK